MSKADFSISQVLAIFIGVICLSVVAYLIFYYFRKSPLNCTQCTAELAAWCVECYKMCGSVNWNGEENAMGNELGECVTKCDLLNAARNYCDSTSFEFCRAYIPL